MEELGSIWFYPESIDELRQNLQYTSFELEALKLKATEETREHEEEMKNLLNRLKIAYQERDETKDQLQKILKNLTQPSNCLLEPANPSLIPPKANSSITESNSFSQSHGSSPVDSFFDTVSSPEFSNINNITDSSYQMGFVNNPFVQVCNARTAKIDPSDTMISDLVATMPQKGLSHQMGFGNPQPFVQKCYTRTVKIDPADAVIDDLLKGKALPQKGKLLQTVIESGPLLQTLLVAGPLPQWRNPPPLQPFRVPPISINACDSVQKPALTLSSGPRMCSSASMLNFASPVSGIKTQIPVAKRQRFH